MTDEYYDYGTTDEAPLVKVTITAAFPGASWVYLFGFGDWSKALAMTASTTTTMTGSQSVFTCELSLPPANYEYKFMVDGKWMLDPTKKVNSRGNHMLTFKDFVEILNKKNRILEEELQRMQISTPATEPPRQALSGDMRKSRAGSMNESGTIGNLEDEEFARGILKKILLDERFRELTLCVNGAINFPCHRAVVAAHSNVLRDILLTNNTNFVEISTNAPLPETFGELLNFFYSGKLDPSLSLAQIDSLLFLATEFQVTSLLPILKRFTAVIACAGNCINLMILFPLDDGLVRTCIVLAARNFGFISRQKEFQKLEWHFLRRILEHPDLHISSPHYVLESIRNWVSQNPNNTEEALAYMHIDRYIPVRRDHLSSTIVCFFADGTERYTSMTTIALTTFLSSTPGAWAGILTHDRLTRDKIMASVPPEHHYRVRHQYTSPTPHFQNWNPTQYKLDIEKFADEFDTIFWMDSDTITTRDLRRFLLDFVESAAAFYFVRDHVNFEEKFRSRWIQQISPEFPMIPQACIMGFKSSVIREFFQIWKAEWESWITPHPFSRFPDPNPEFPGSAFCIEQYSLGTALAIYSTRKGSTNTHHYGQDFNAPAQNTPQDNRTNTEQTQSHAQPQQQFQYQPQEPQQPQQPQHQDHGPAHTNYFDEEYHTYSSTSNRLTRPEREIVREFSRTLVILPKTYSYFKQHQMYDVADSQSLSIPISEFLSELEAQYLSQQELVLYETWMDSLLLVSQMRISRVIPYRVISQLMISQSINISQFVGVLSGGQNLSQLFTQLEIVSLPGFGSLSPVISNLYSSFTAARAPPPQNTLVSPDAIHSQLEQPTPTQQPSPTTSTATSASLGSSVKSIILVDYFGDGVIHSYNQNYVDTLAWYSQQQKNTNPTS